MITKNGILLSEKLGLNLPAEIHLASILARHTKTFKRTASEIQKGPESFAEIPDMFYAKRKGVLARMESLIVYWVEELDTDCSSELIFNTETGDIDMRFRDQVLSV